MQTFRICHIITRAFEDFTSCQHKVGQICEVEERSGIVSKILYIFGSFKTPRQFFCKHQSLATGSQLDLELYSDLIVLKDEYVVIYTPPFNLWLVVAVT